MSRTLSHSRWSPLSFDDLRKEMNQVFEGLFDQESKSSGYFAPSVNFAETEAAYEISAELPGIKPEDVNVELHEGHLWITGEHKEESEQKEKTYHRVERRYGKFRRVFALGNDVNADQVDAQYKDGVLTVTVPKAEAVRPRKIEVKG